LFMFVHSLRRCAQINLGLLESSQVFEGLVITLLQGCIRLLFLKKKNQGCLLPCQFHFFSIPSKNHPCPTIYFQDIVSVATYIHPCLLGLIKYHTCILFPPTPSLFGLKTVEGQCGKAEVGVGEGTYRGRGKRASG